MASKKQLATVAAEHGRSSTGRAKDIPAPATATSKMTQEDKESLRSKPFAARMSQWLGNLSSTSQVLVSAGTEAAATLVRGMVSGYFTWAKKFAIPIENQLGNAFSFWVRDILPEVGMATGTVYRYLNLTKVVCEAVKYELAQEALIAITGGTGLLEKDDDGKPALSKAAITVFAKYPIPTSGTYEACLDWARHCKEKMYTKSAGIRSVSDSASLIRKEYGFLLFGIGKNQSKRSANLTIASGVLVDCYRLLKGKNEALASVAIAAMEDDAVTTPSEVKEGQPSMVAKLCTEVLKAPKPVARGEVIAHRGTEPVVHVA